MAPRHGMMTNGSYSPKQPYSQLANSNICRNQQQQQRQQQQQTGNRALSASATGLPQCYQKYNANMPTRPGHQGFNNLTRAYYNPVC